jgi:hypothetical protein
LEDGAGTRTTASASAVSCSPVKTQPVIGRPGGEVGGRSDQLDLVPLPGQQFGQDAAEVVMIVVEDKHTSSVMAHPGSAPRLARQRHDLTMYKRISSDEKCGYVPAGRVIPPSKSCLLPVNRRI